MTEIRFGGRCEKHLCPKPCEKCAGSNDSSAITVPRETWDAMREALESVEWHGGGSCWIVDDDKIEAALTAAKAVSHQKPETTPAPEGGAITSESAANAVSEQVHVGVLPIEGSEAADNAIHAMLCERQWPSSSMNAARAGWRAARLFAHPQATEPAEKRKLYECTGCGHLYLERTSSCECMENPANTYNDWVATPAAPEAKQ